MAGTDFIHPPQGKPIDGFQAARRIESEWTRARDRELRRLEEQGMAPADAICHEITLRRMKFASSSMVTMDYLQRATCHVEYDVMRRVIRASIQGLIPAMGGDSLVVPKSWWDHLKRDMPRRARGLCEWMLRRPLIVETERYEVTRFVAGLPPLRDERLTFMDRFRRVEEP